MENSKSKSYKEYLHELEAGDVRSLEELAWMAGYTNSVRLEHLPGYKSRYKEAEKYEKRCRNGDFEMEGMSLSTGPGWREPTNFLRAYDNGFVNATPSMQDYVALGIIDTRVESFRYPHGAVGEGKILAQIPGIGGSRFALERKLVDRESPTGILYMGRLKNGILESEKFLDTLCDVIREYDPNHLRPIEVTAAASKMFRNMFLIMGTMIGSYYFFPDTMKHFDSYISRTGSLPLLLVGVGAAGIYPFFQIDRHYNKYAIKKMIKKANAI